MQTDFIKSSAPEAWDLQGTGSAAGAGGGSSSAGSAVNTQDTSQNFAGFTDIGSGFEGGNVLFRNSGYLRLGQGDNSVIFDANDALYRVAVGSETYAIAPFRVQKDGKFHAGSSSQYIDWDGTKLTIAGDVVQIDTSTGAVKGSLQNVISLTAGETISGATTPVAVFLQGSSNLGTPSLQESETTGSTDATFTSAGTYRFSQSFTATNFDTISSIYLKMSVNFGTATTYTLNLFNADANDKPTGSTLGTATKITRIGTDYWHEFVFSSPITITQGNKYAMVVHTSDNQCTILYNNAGSYAGGKYASSTDSGATWTVNASYDLVFKVYGYKARTPGYVYKADIDNKYMSNFIGFAITTASSGNSITVQTSGVVSGFSGLTPSLRYSFDSSGLVTTVINGYEKIIIGEAISTTQILIDDKKSNVFDMDLEYEYKLQDLTMNDLTVTKGSNDSFSAYKEGYNYSGYTGANGSDSMYLSLSTTAASDSRSLRGIDITKYNEIKSSYLIKTATDATTGVPIYGFVGLSSFASAISTTSQVTNHVGFIFEAISDEYPLLFNVYCSCADGVTQTTSEVVGFGLLPENENNYKVIIYNSEARFYINGILVGRITTNLPTAITGTVFFSSYTGVVSSKSNASRADNIKITITRSGL